VANLRTVTYNVRHCNTLNTPQHAGWLTIEGILKVFASTPCVLECIALCWSVMHCDALCFIVMQCVAACRSASQRVAVRRSVFKWIVLARRHVQSITSGVCHDFSYLCHVASLVVRVALSLLPVPSTRPLIRECCRGLQCVAVHCSALQCDERRCSVLLCCSVRQCATRCHSVLQCSSLLQCWIASFALSLLPQLLAVFKMGRVSIQSFRSQWMELICVVAVCCSVLQCVAVCCSVRTHLHLFNNGYMTRIQNRLFDGCNTLQYTHTLIDTDAWWMDNA